MMNTDTLDVIDDYNLNGESTLHAIESDLPDANWYQSPVRKDEMRELIKRKDSPAIKDTTIWLRLLLMSGVAIYML